MLGLKFSIVDDRRLATPGEQFWSVWRHDRAAVVALGLRCKKDGDAWFVEDTLGIIDDARLSVAEDLQLAAFAVGRDRSEHQRIVDQQARIDEDIRRREKEGKRDFTRGKLITRFGDQADTDLVAAAQREGMATLTQWGAFCVNKAKMHTFTAADAKISLVQAVWLTELVDQTTTKAETTRNNLKASDNAVDWSDDDVVSAVERLTWDDHDRAGIENGLGWSKADSSKGHWCWGMIKRGGADRMIGIDAARAIVGKYAGQLGREGRAA